MIFRFFCFLFNDFLFNNYLLLENETYLKKVSSIWKEWLTTNRYYETIFVHDFFFLIFLFSLQLFNNYLH